MTIYIQKDHENEYRFNNWEDVISYAKERDKHDSAIENLEKELTIEILKQEKK